jgi:hypothetical protein
MAVVTQARWPKEGLTEAPAQQPETTVELLARHDVRVVRPGVARARRRLETAKARWTLVVPALPWWGVVLGAALQLVFGPGSPNRVLHIISWIVMLLGALALVPAAGLTLRAVTVCLEWRDKTLEAYRKVPGWARAIAGQVQAAYDGAAYIRVDYLVAVNPGWLDRVVYFLKSKGMVVSWLTNAVLDPQMWLVHPESEHCLCSWGTNQKQHWALHVPVRRAGRN